MIEVELTIVIASIAGIAIPLMLQTAAIVWWASQMAARVRSLEQQQAHESESRHPERLIKLETYVEIIQKQQDEQMLLLRDLARMLREEKK